MYQSLLTHVRNIRFFDYVIAPREIYSICMLFVSLFSGFQNQFGCSDNDSKRLAGIKNDSNLEYFAEWLHSVASKKLSTCVCISADDCRDLHGVQQPPRPCAAAQANVPPRPVP